MRPASWTSFPEVFPSSADLSTRVTRAARRGRLRRVHGRIYTPNLRDPLEEIVGRNRWQVAALLFPGAVVSHRSALPGVGGAGGSRAGRGDGVEGVGADPLLFLTGAYDRIVRVPGLRIRQMAGPGPLPGDEPTDEGLFRASPARALLECLSVQRIRGASPAPPREGLLAAVRQLLAAGITGRSLLRDAGELAAPLRAGAAVERLGHLLAELEAGAGPGHPAASLPLLPSSRPGGAPGPGRPPLPAGSDPLVRGGRPGGRAAPTDPGALHPPPGSPPAGAPRPGAHGPGSHGPGSHWPAAYGRGTALPGAPPAGSGWDRAVIRTLEELREVLSTWSPAPRADLVRSGSPWTTLAFLDAWSSCALEGRGFDPAEVERAVFHRRVTPGREGDVAVLLGTWRLLASPVEMTFSARDRSAEGFVTRLHRHHRGLFPSGVAVRTPVRGVGAGAMEPGAEGVATAPSQGPAGGRAESDREGGSPGEGGRGGETPPPPGWGVPEGRIDATLARGHELYRTLGEPLPRAAFLLALITAVHPFADGSGIVARATMNAELIAAGERRILFVPAEEPPYLPALEHFRAEGDPAPFLRLLEGAQARTAALDVRNRLKAATEVAGWGEDRRRRWGRIRPFG